MVQGARHPEGVNPSPIVEPEGDVGGLLDLVEEDAGAQSVGVPAGISTVIPGAAGTRRRHPPADPLARRHEAANSSSITPGSSPR